MKWVFLALTAALAAFVIWVFINIVPPANAATELPPAPAPIITTAPPIAVDHALPPAVEVKAVKPKAIEAVPPPKAEPVEPEPIVVPPLDVAPLKAEAKPRRRYRKRATRCVIEVPCLW